MSEQQLKEKAISELKGKINEKMCNYMEEFIKIGKKIKEGEEEYLMKHYGTQKSK